MLNKAFNANNPFWQSMGTVYDLFIVNTLWLLCCIPVITIGPATAASYYCLTERLLGQGGSISRDFFRSFRQNLRQGILLGVPVHLLGVFLLFDMWLCRRAGTGIFTFFLFFFGVIFLFWCFTVLYLYPLMAKFERSSKELLIWSFTLSVRNLSMTLVMLLVAAAAVWFCTILPGLIFIMFGITAQFCTTVIVSIIKPWLPPREPVSDEEDTAYAGPAGSKDTDNTYADFDEAAFYGYDKKEMEALMRADGHED